MERYVVLPQASYVVRDYTLVSLRKQDILKIKEWRNAQIDILRQKKPLTDQDQTHYYNSVISPTYGQQYPEQILFSILQNGFCIGYGGLVHISWEDKRAEISFLVDNDRISDWRIEQGDFESYLEIIKYISFNDLGLNRLHLEIYDIREKHIQTIEKVGFILEGRLKQHVIINGAHADSVIYGMVKADYEKSNTDSFNVLVTSASGKIPLIESVKKGVRKIDAQGKVIAADINNKCPAVYFADGFWQLPPIDRLSPEHLIAYCKKENIRAIIPTRDGELSYFSKVKQRLEKDNIRVMISELQSVNTCMDKLCFYTCSQKYGLPSIPTFLTLEEVRADAFVVKERFGAGSNRIGINLTMGQAVAYAKILSDPVYQPFIRGSEISVDIYIAKGCVIKGMVMRTRDEVVNGESRVTSAFYDHSLAQLCERFIEPFEFYGHIIFQVIQDNLGDFHIIECNPRFGGASTLSVFSGLDSFFWFLLEARGADITDYPFIFDKDKKIKQVRYPKDKIIIEQ